MRIKLLIILTAFVSSFAETARYVITNPSSGTATLPAIADPRDFPELANAEFVTDGDDVFAVDVFEGEMFIEARLEPYRTARIQPTDRQKYYPDWGDEGGVNLLRFAGNINFRIDNGGIALDDVYIARNTKIDWWRKTYEGFGVFRFERGDFKIDCFSTGSARVSTKNGVGIEPVGPVTIQKPGEAFIARPARRGDIINGPLESVRLNRTALFIPAKGSRWIYRYGRLEPVDDGKTTAWIIRCDDETGILKTALAAATPIIGKQQNEKWYYSAGDYRAEVENALPAEHLKNAEWIWKTTAGKTVGKWTFDNDRSFQANPVMSVYSFNGQSFDHRLTFTDTTGRGFFLEGSLLAGGILTSTKTNQAGALDLDGDGDGDVFYAGSEDYTFDIADAVPALHCIKIGPSPCGCRLEKIFDESVARKTNTPLLKSTISAERTYNNARLSLAEKYFYCTENGGKNTQTLLLNIVDNKIKQITIGSAEANQTAAEEFLSLEVLRPDYSARPATCRYLDPYMNIIVFTSAIMPTRWQGRTLDPRKLITPLPASPLGGTAIKANFVPEYNADGNKSSSRRHRRIEIAENIHLPAAELYYSPLIGGLHLKQAGFGVQTLSRTEHQSSPAVSMYYFDDSGDGYFDTYLYDPDGDGIIDRSLKYDRTGELMKITEAGISTFYPYQMKYEHADLGVSGLNEVKGLRDRGLAELPMPARAFLADSGVPVEWAYGKERLMHVFAANEKRPDFCVIAPPRWQAQAGIDAFHSTPDGEHFGIAESLTALNVNCRATGLETEFLSAPFNGTLLNNLKMLFLPSPINPLTAAESALLYEWIEKGGTLIAFPLTGAEEHIRPLAELYEDLGVKIKNRPLLSGIAEKPYSLSLPSAAQNTNGTPPLPFTVIAAFPRLTSAETELIEKISILEFTGFALGPNFDDYQPLLQCAGEPVVISRQIGKGKVILCGVNIFSNSNIPAPDDSPRNGNREFIRRLLKANIAPDAVVSVKGLAAGAKEKSFTIKGGGGPVKIPRCHNHRRIYVNGQEISREADGMFEIIRLPSGISRVRILDEDIANEP